MKSGNIFKLIIAIIIPQLTGIIGALFTTPAIPTWYAGLIKPELAPPNWLFAPVWTTLFVLMGISLYLVWKNDWQVRNQILLPKRRAWLRPAHHKWNRWSERFWVGDLQKQNIIAIFAIQLVLNVLWSFIFFGLQQPAWAFFELLALWFAILYTIVNFYRISKPAAWLLVPYILWVTVAGYLNFAIWMLNV